VIAALLTLPLTYLTAQFSTLATVFFMPYQLWIAVAASLAVGYAHLNKTSSTR
jgi:tryptophan-rich sensory protein